MTDKRFKRFNKELSLYASNPFFKKINNLYVNNIIKSIPSAEKILKKIKITKKNELYKSSIKIAGDINQKYSILKGVEILGKNKINERIIDHIDIKSINNNGWGLWLHEKEFIEMEKQVKNAIYIQVVEFYNSSGVKINQKTKTLRTPLVLKGKNRKNFFGYIADVMTDGITYEWLIRIWAEEKNGNYAKITTTAYKKINKIQNVDLKQLYQRSETKTCVYEGFLKFFNNSSDKHKKAMYNKLLNNKHIYGKAYTDETLQEICNFTQSTLIIKDLVRGKDYDKITKSNNSRWVIYFMNTKYNHLDLLMHSYEEVIELDNLDEYEKIKANTETWIETFGKLITLEKTYKVKDDDFKIVYNKWKKDVNYNDLQIEETSEEMKLINTYDYSMHTMINDYEIDNNLYDEVDYKKAYYNYSNKKINNNYHGIPSGSFINQNCDETFNIDTFNKQLNNKLIGFYQVKILKINKYINHYNKLGFFENNIHTFTTAEIKEMKQDILFQFLSMSISPSTDIPFTEDFLKSTDIYKYYCKAVGLTMKTSDPISITVKPLHCDLKYYQIIKDDNFEMFENNGTIKIHNKTDIEKSCRHIGYYIHSYIKTLILQQLKQINIDDVFGIKLDSIIIKKNAPIKKIISGFHETFKKCKIEELLGKKQNNKTFKCLGNKWYEDEDENEYIGNTLEELNASFSKPNIKNEKNAGYYRPLYLPSTEIINFKSSILPNNEMITSNVIFLSGKGGSGKSFSILSNLNSVCMVSTCWNLTQAKKDEYPSLQALSINKLVDDECRKVKVSNKILFLDELTMWKEADILKAIKENPRKFIFMAGDIDYNGRYYQCSMGQTIINPSTIKNIQFVTYTKNYRFDDELNNILDGLRKCITKQEQTDYINIYFKNNFKNKEDVIFDDKTIGISDLNDSKQDNELTNYFISKGGSPQYYIKNTNYELKQYKGARLDEIPSHNNYECKLFKTIHSFQGLDLKRDEKIVISNKKNFDFNLWYTAFSRARRLDQIIILNN